MDKEIETHNLTLDDLKVREHLYTLEKTNFDYLIDDNNKVSEFEAYYINLTLHFYTLKKYFDDLEMDHFRTYFLRVLNSDCDKKFITLEQSRAIKLFFEKKFNI
jgi:hypothetical protein